MKAICPNCGAVYEDGSEFCSVCGTKPDPENIAITDEFTSEHGAFQAQNEAPAANQFPPLGEQDKKKKTKKISGKKFIIIGGAALLLVLFIVLIAVLFSNGGGDSGKTDITTNDPVNKTVMVYVVGSDLESEGKNATVDLSEISRSGVNTDANNILVCTGGAAKWHNDYVTAEENAILKLNSDSFEKVESYPVSNMADSSTLTRFINYGMSTYPNDQYILILWNHGAGPIFGYGQDELHENDLLTMDELQTALKDANVGSKNKFELIGFDACIMANIETAWCLKDYANYLVASQETEPGTGWDYSFLKKLEYYPDGKALATEIIDSYYTTTLKNYSSNVELTLSCLDLSKIEATEKCLNDLFADVNSYISAGGFAELSQKRYETKEFAKSSDPDMLSMDIVDLNHLAILLEENYPEKSKALQDSISELVCYSQTNVENSSGISVWYPYLSSPYIEEFITIYSNYDFADNYTKYVLSFAYSMLGCDPEDAVQYSDVTLKMKSSNNFSTQISAEQAASLAGVQYIVYGKIDAADSLSGKDEYIPVFIEDNLAVDGNGTINASYDTKALFAIDCGTGDDHGIPIFLDCIHDGSENPKYSTDATFITNDNENSDFESTNVSWIIRIDGDKANFGEGVLKPDKSDKDTTVTNRTVNPNDYDSYLVANPSFFLKTDKNGSVSFEYTDNLYGYYLNKDTGYELEYREIEDPENYYVCFKFIDIYGNETYSNLAPLVQ